MGSTRNYWITCSLQKAWTVRVKAISFSWSFHTYHKLVHGVPTHMFLGLERHCPLTKEYKPAKKQKKILHHIVSIKSIKTPNLLDFTQKDQHAVGSEGICFHSYSLYFPAKEGKAISNLYYHIIYKMKRYAGQNEVRFKVTDKQMEIYDETAWYLYENNIQSFGRWCMDYFCKFYRQGVIESKIMKQQQEIESDSKASIFILTILYK
jgi:hypothetical protein